MRLPSGMRQLLKRPIEKKFKSAIPLHSGDSLLLSLLGKIISRPGLAEKAFGEGEVFLIKGGLFLSGVNVDPSADEGIGTEWKEDSGQHHYNPSAGLRRPRPGPYAIHDAPRILLAHILESQLALCVATGKRQSVPLPGRVAPVYCSV